MMITFTLLPQTQIERTIYFLTNIQHSLQLPDQFFGAANQYNIIISNFILIVNDPDEQLKIIKLPSSVFWLRSDLPII